MYISCVCWGRGRRNHRNHPCSLFDLYSTSASTVGKTCKVHLVTRYPSTVGK